MKSAKKSSLKKTKGKNSGSKARASQARGPKKAVKKRAIRGAPRKVGIFGGSFDPFHNGHLSSIKAVAEAYGLKEVRVVPAFQSPLRKLVQGSKPDQRLAMAALGIRENRDLILVDDSEIFRGGVSYTIDTLRKFKSKKTNEKLNLIIGMDQFENFDQWKEYSEILKLSDLIVTSRPGLELPKSVEDFPAGLRILIKKFARNVAETTLGTKISFIQLMDVEVSATEIRRRIREHQSIVDLVPEGVATYIAEHGLYETVAKTIGDYEQFTRQCAELLAGKGAINIQGYDLRSADAATDFTLVASGTSTRHTSALAEGIMREVKKALGVWPQGVEGISEGRWVVLDYGSLIIHVFYDFVRQEYRLENLWKKGKQMMIENPTTPLARFVDEKSKSSQQPS